MIPPLLAARFPEHVRARGQAYVDQRRVELTAVLDRLAATVRGTREYDVSLVRDGDAAVLGCECPYAAEHGYCKHLWAMLVAADRADVLAPIVQGVVRVELHEPPPRDDPRAPARDALRDRPHAPPPAWAQVLARARHGWPAPAPPAPWSPDRVLVFLLDLPASRQNAEGLVVHLATEQRRRDGTWGAAQPLRREAGDALESLPDADDRFLLQLLRGTPRTTDYHWRAGDTSGGFVVGAGVFDTVWRRLCDTGRLRLRRGTHERPEGSVRWDGGAPWTFQLAIEPAAARDTYALRGELTRDAETMPVSAADLLHPSGLMVARDALSRVARDASFALLRELHAHESLPIGAGELPRVLEKLYALSGVPLVRLPDSVGVRTASPAPVPLLALSSAAGYSRRILVHAGVDYDGVLVDPHEPGDARFDARRMLAVRRDVDAERGYVERLAELGARMEREGRTGVASRTVPVDQLEPMVAALADEGWRITIDGVRRRRASGVRARVSSGIDWFAIDGTLDFDGERVPLPDVLRALREGATAVPLADGSEGHLTDEWRRRLAPLVAAAGLTRDGARFQRAQLSLLDALLAGMPEVETDARTERARTELRGFERVEPAQPPATFTGTLRPYQQEGLGWFRFLERFGLGGCLADDMGLGKTVQVLALLAARQAEGAASGPSLVVVPRSLAFNWREEARRFVPSLRVLEHTGAQRARAAPDVGGVDLVITTYGTLRRDATMLHAIEFDYVILDEAQAIKNATTASAKAARLLRARHRLALTGTPIENRLEELWSLLEFLNPGMLGAATAFRALARDRTRGRGADAALAAPPNAGRELLRRALRPVILRRTKEQVAPDLPARLEQTLLIELEAPQRKVYDDLLAHYRQSLLPRVEEEGVARTAMQVLEALLRLRQAACHPALIDPSSTDAPSAKLDALVPMLAEVVAEGHRALVFSQFTSFLALLRERLDAEGLTYEYLDGRTQDRQGTVARFQSGEGAPLFLISLRAGGQGLNLTAADYVYLLDPWWNPAVEAQAVDRAHRIGQTRQVIATRLVAHDTVEEKILEMQRAKRDLADAILGEDQGMLASIGAEELAMLLG